MIFRKRLTIISFVIILSGLVIFPANAQEELQDRSTIFENSIYRQLMTASKKNLTEKLNQSVTDNGITVTLNEIYYFDNELSYSMTVESKKKFTNEESTENNLIAEPFRYLGRPHIKYNGKTINFASSLWYEKVSDKKVAMILKVHPNTKISNNEVFEMTFNQVMNTKGYWNFKMPVKEADNNVIKIDNAAKKEGDVKLELHHIKWNDAEVSVNFTEERSLTNADMVAFNLITDNGDALELFTGYQSSISQINQEDNTVTTEYFFKFALPEDGVSQLTFSPHIDAEFYQTLTKSSEKLDPKELPITLSQGEIGSLLITDIEYKDDKTIVTYEDHLKYPISQVYPGNNIWLENNSHKNVSSVYIVRNLLGKVKPVGLHNTYIAEFPVTGIESSPLKVASWLYPYPEVFEKLQYTIPLDGF
ncbi:DUF4179 domain-containing protein [Gracilibacillus oryzae]|uniref:DUF4179 domain-containing protein n=1 Tax=Gracilibacillus oryzae TaxID=1672701 RepID=A0A7C8GVC1_9BACI|nr:DUF4179 domain-containing protein [Gracilibacillus oryzae]KAB8138097.1 DUF4179 domain-containing protein [Gracilibacillus oryzae]